MGLKCYSPDVANITFLLSFPKDPDLRKKWIIATKRKDFEPSQWSSLCSKHFSTDAFQIRPNAFFELLNPGAIPTIFEFPEHLKLSPAKKRRTIIVKAQLVMDLQAKEIPPKSSRVSRKKRGGRRKGKKLEEEAFYHPGSPNSKKIKIEIDSDDEGVAGGGGGVEEEEEKIDDNDEEEEMEQTVNGEDEMIDIDESAFLTVKRELIDEDVLVPQVNIKVEEMSVEGEENGNDDVSNNLEEPNQVFLPVKEEIDTGSEENGLQEEKDGDEEGEGEEEEDSGGGGGGGVRRCCHSSDDVRLIEAVRQFRELYDIWHLYYANSWRRQDCWAQVAQVVNWTAEECRKRWTQLRDNYRKTKRRMKKTNQTSTGDEHLSFLDEVFYPRPQYLGADSASGRGEIVFNTGAACESASENGASVTACEPAFTGNGSGGCESVFTENGEPENGGSATACESVISSSAPGKGVRKVVGPGKRDDNETTRFLELYASERLLYDPSIKQYRDQEARTAAAQRICDALGGAAAGLAGPRDVVKRFKHMRDSYCHELKRKAKLEAKAVADDGTPISSFYRPRLFYFDQINAFLRPFVNVKSSPTKEVATEKGNTNNIAAATTTTTDNTNNNNMTIMTDHHLHPSGIMLEQNMVYHHSPPHSPSSPSPPPAPLPPPPSMLLESIGDQLYLPVTGLAPVTVPAPITVPGCDDSSNSYSESDSQMVIDADPLAIDPLEMDYTSDSCSMGGQMFISRGPVIGNSDSVSALFSEKELMELPTRELNKRCRGLPAQIVRRLKMKRRTLKNRSYANNSRTKRSNRSIQLEMQNKELMDTLGRLESTLFQVRAERDFYKKQCQTLREAVSADKLTEIGDFDPPQSLAQLLLQLPRQSPPPLRPLDTATNEQLQLLGTASKESSQLLETATEEPPQLLEIGTREPSQLLETVTKERPNSHETATKEPSQLLEIGTKERPKLPETATKERSKLPETATKERPKLLETTTKERSQSVWHPPPLRPLSPKQILETGTKEPSQLSVSVQSQLLSQPPALRPLSPKQVLETGTKETSQLSVSVQSQLLSQPPALRPLSPKLVLETGTKEPSQLSVSVQSQLLSQPPPLRLLSSKQLPDTKRSQLLSNSHSDPPPLRPLAPKPLPKEPSPLPLLSQILSQSQDPLPESKRLVFLVLGPSNNVGSSETGTKELSLVPVDSQLLDSLPKTVAEPQLKQIPGECSPEQVEERLPTVEPLPQKGRLSVKRVEEMNSMEPLPDLVQSQKRLKVKSVEQLSVKAEEQLSVESEEQLP